MLILQLPKQSQAQRLHNQNIPKPTSKTLNRQREILIKKSKRGRKEKRDERRMKN
jgi:hypothetical protein